MFLFDGSILKNIVLDEKYVDKTRLMKSLKASSLTKMIKQLPDGLETVVGERGVSLSGGQRQ